MIRQNYPLFFIGVFQKTKGYNLKVVKLKKAAAGFSALTGALLAASGVAQGLIKRYQPGINGYAVKPVDAADFFVVQNEPGLFREILNLAVSQILTQ